MIIIIIIVVVIIITKQCALGKGASASHMYSETRPNLGMRSTRQTAVCMTLLRDITRQLTINNAQHKCYKRFLTQC